MLTEQSPAIKRLIETCKECEAMTPKIEGAKVFVDGPNVFVVTINPSFRTVYCGHNGGELVVVGDSDVGWPIFAPQAVKDLMMDRGMEDIPHLEPIDLGRGILLVND